jgi:hypothetical protein
VIDGHDLVGIVAQADVARALDNPQVAGSHLAPLAFSARRQLDPENRTDHEGRRIRLSRAAKHGCQ